MSDNENNLIKIRLGEHFKFIYKYIELCFLPEIFYLFLFRCYTFIIIYIKNLQSFKIHMHIIAYV